MNDEEDPEIAAGNPLGAIPAADGSPTDPMSERQAVRLRHLCERANEPFDASLNRRQAGARISALQDMLD